MSDWIAANYDLLRGIHILAIIAWMAGLLYLPRLFVYHAMCAPDDRVGIERFKTMERKLYYGIMMPGMVLTVVFGTWLWLGYGITGGWMHAKFALVLVLLAYHVYLGKLLARRAGVALPQPALDAVGELVPGERREAPREAGRGDVDPEGFVEVLDAEGGGAIVHCCSVTAGRCCRRRA